MRKRLRAFWQILKTTFKNWNAKDPFKESAAIAYYAIFSLPGLLVLVITLAGYFFNKGDVTEYIFYEIGDIIGHESGKEVRKVIINAGQIKNSWLAATIGIVTMLVGATGLFAQFQKSLNNIWGVKPDTTHHKGWLVMLRTRLFSFGLIVSIAFLLLLSLVVTSLLSVMAEWLRLYFPDGILWVFDILNFVISLSIIALLFALMFKILPDAKIKWRYIWVGAFGTAFLFELGKFALGLYFGNANPGSAYGAAGSIILVLLWVSYSSMIVFFGAEFTRAYTEHYEHKIEPAKYAVKAPVQEINKK